MDFNFNFDAESQSSANVKDDVQVVVPISTTLRVYDGSTDLQNMEMQKQQQDFQKMMIKIDCDPNIRQLKASVYHEDYTLIEAVRHELLKDPRLVGINPLKYGNNTTKLLCDMWLTDDGQVLVLEVEDTDWMDINQYLYVDGVGFMKIMEVIDDKKVRVCYNHYSGFELKSVFMKKGTVVEQGGMGFVGTRKDNPLDKYITIRLVTKPNMEKQRTEIELIDCIKMASKRARKMCMDLKKGFDDIFNDGKDKNSQILIPGQLNETSNTNRETLPPNTVLFDFGF